MRRNNFSSPRRPRFGGCWTGVVLGLTDLGIVFEAKQPLLLVTWISARQAMALKECAGAKEVHGEINGIKYVGVVSTNRAVSSYLASNGSMVFVCNSLTQMQNLLDTAKGKRAALLKQDEYIFFRSRYSRGDKAESALLVLTDATIRRWCGPQWRIAASRRTQAAAVMAEMQAANLQDLAQGKAVGVRIPNRFKLTDAGDFFLSPQGVSSSVYNTLEFMTPISELPLTKVTKAEADAYERWRDGYQSNWRQVFDPIAIRFSVVPGSLSADMTVMPLIVGTRYRDLINLTQRGQLLADSGDRHPESLAHIVMALDPESEMVKRSGGFLGSMSADLKANPLGWLGQSISIYADEDPFWQQLSAATNASVFFRHNYWQLPVALHCEVKNSLALGLFLSSARSYFQQSAPNTMLWQTVEYNGKSYVKISASSQADSDMANLAVYYAITPKALVLTMNEPLLKRAMDRSATNSAATLPSWLGANLGLQVKQAFLQGIKHFASDESQKKLQLLSWNNLPILNEWKRLYPAQDPMKFHEQFWQTKLICPGGGAYVWNEKWQTMESTAFGHPGEPRMPAGKLTLLDRITMANFGLSFEDKGLRTKVILDR